MILSGILVIVNGCLKLTDFGDLIFNFLWFDAKVPFRFGLMLNRIGFFLQSL